MKKRFKVLCAALSAFVVVVLAGCTTFQADGLAMSYGMGDMQVLGQFHRSVLVSEFLGAPGGGNLFNISATAMSGKINSIVSQEVAKMGGNGAINISIRYWNGPILKLLNAITGTIWAPSRLEITGQVVLSRSIAAPGGPANVIIQKQVEASGGSSSSNANNSQSTSTSTSSSTSAASSAAPASTQ